MYTSDDDGDGDMTWMLATTPADWLGSRHCSSWHGACNVTTPAECGAAQYPSQPDRCGPRDTLSLPVRSGQIEICHTSSSSRLSVIDAATVRSFVIYISTVHYPTIHSFRRWRRLGRCLEPIHVHKLVSLVLVSDTELSGMSTATHWNVCIVLPWTSTYLILVMVIHTIIIVVWTIFPRISEGLH